ncbi:MAG: hypothetical protein PUF28_07580, partial [bacterium]|nr:hypothetical protein [bacterium]
FFYQKFEFGKEEPASEQEQIKSKREEPALEQTQSEVSKKGPAFSGWALSGATRRTEQKWMLFERSEFHPFPARSKAK